MPDSFLQKKIFFGSSLWPVFNPRDVFGFIFRSKLGKLVSKFYRNLNFKPQKGATLVELLVMVSIVAILTVLMVPNYRSGDSHLALQRSASKLAQDIRRAEEMAVSAKECAACGGVPRGYGIYLTAGATSYYLYADTFPAAAANEKYDSGQDVIVETISLEKGVYVQSVSPAPLSINFRPPDPAVKISNGGAGVNETTIVLSLQNNILKIKNVKANKTGLIYVE
jgi:Tfp pilus assembly protein FimT